MYHFQLLPSNYTMTEKAWMEAWKTAARKMTAKNQRKSGRKEEPEELTRRMVSQKSWKEREQGKADKKDKSQRAGRKES